MTQLHLHTKYSILDGIGSAKDYAKKAVQYNHKSMGITDHGRMGGLLEFQNEMIKNDIKPLLGIEQYLSDNLYVLDEKGKRKRTKNNHVILYASNEEGYKNLLNLNYLSVQEDHFYYSPRIIKEELFKYSSGIIMGSACLASRFGRLLLDENNPELAEEEFKQYLEVFKDNMYLEIQMNELLELQKKYNEFIIYLHKKYSVPLCLTGDVHYANPEDNKMQTLSIMISRKQTIDDMSKEDFWDIDAKSLFYHNEQDYLNFNKQWEYGYSDDFIKECLNTTDIIASKINYIIPKRTKIHIPSFKNNEAILDKKINDGIKEKFPYGMPDNYYDRINYELNVIKEANLIDYFLIVEDYHHYSKHKLGSFSNIGRGSGGGSLLLYLLDVTALDPIKNGLIFERFLTRERLKKDFPDIDSDFPLAIKENIQKYLINKYGVDRVLHVGTYTQLGLKSAAKDLCRIYKIDYTKSNEFTKFIDNDLTWEENVECFKQNDTIAPFYEENKSILDLTPKLDGLIKNGGVHASGLVILDDDAKNILPVDRVNGEIVTAFQESGSCTELDSIGVIKFDILGLETLGIIEKTYKNIVKYNPDTQFKTEEEWKRFLFNLPLDDCGIYEEVNKENKYALFQMSGNAYSQLAMEIKPKNFEEINALNAMSRPGTINFLDSYKEGKKGAIKYHPKINSLLKETYGCIMYQEQVMEIFHKIGGFTLEEADGVRSLMKKLSKKDKKPEDLEKWNNVCKRFADGAKQLGMTDKEIQNIQSDILGFAEYSFNKCFAGSSIIDGYDFGYVRTIEDIFKEDYYNKALSLDYESKELIINDIEDIRFAGYREVYCITVDNGFSVKVTSNHNFPIYNKGKILELNLLNGLKEGHILFTKSGMAKIISIEFAGYENTYNIEMKAPYHTVCVDGIIAKNSHCSSYTYIGAITAYLSNHYKHEFYCAALNSESTQDGLIGGLNSCIAHNIKLIPPDINISESDFSISKNREIVFGFNGIKYVGSKAIDLIVANRPYKSFEDFILNPNLKSKAITKRTIEYLIMAGCFDSLNNNRKYLLSTFQFLREGKQIPDIMNDIITTQEDYENYEKEFLGFNMFFTKFRPDVIARLNKINANLDFTSITTSAKHTLCLVESKRVLNDKNGNEMAFVTIKDKVGKTISLPIFSSIWIYLKDKIIDNNLYVLMLRKDIKNGKESIMLGMHGFVKDKETIQKYAVNITEKLREKK